MASGLLRWPPAGAAVSRVDLWTAWRGRDPARELTAGLQRRLGGAPLTLHASGREALRVALVRLAAQRGRSELLVPAYACYSVPAAGVAAGLHVRLVDVTPEGRVDPKALARLPLERAAALVVNNLFGVPEPLGDLRAALAGSGVALIDDAAQALGARDADGPVGARGEVGVLSFGRGKPLSGLGGGAALWSGLSGPPGTASRPRPGIAVTRGLAYDVARRPAVFRWLAAVPALAIGQTHFDPGFRRGAIDGASLCLAAAALRHLEADGRAREARALALGREISGASGFVPLLAARDAAGVYPRLALVAPDAGSRKNALGALRDLGATAMYPDSLDRVAPLAPHRADRDPCPQARDLAARLLTLPTFREIRGARRARTLETLAGLSR